MIHYEGHGVQLNHGDCLDVLRTLPDASVDAVVTDPPYGLGFMGQKWDTYANETGRAPAAGAKFDHVGGNHNPTSSADASRTRRVEAKRFGEWCELWAVECLRVLKPGGHLLAFGGTRTWHRLTCAVEDAGFEIRDSIAWLYGSGFPKSLDVSKAIDKLDATHERRDRALRFTAWLRSTGITTRQVDEATGTNMGGHYLTAESQPAVATVAHLDALRPLLPDVPEWVEEMARQRTVESQNFAAREVVGERTTGRGTGKGAVAYIADSENRDVTAPATPDAQTWQGWGTALKPAFEPVVVARKPLTGTVAATVLLHGTGALNIDACRIEHASAADLATSLSKNPGRTDAVTSGVYGADRPQQRVNTAGRWPSNVVLDEHQAATLNEMSGDRAGDSPNRKPRQNTAEAHNRTVSMGRATKDWLTTGHDDTGGASRFFYVAREDNEPWPTPELASTAGLTSSQPSAPDGSAPNGAATSEPHDTGKPTDSPSTNGTQSGSRPTSASDTPQTKAGGESSPAWPLGEPSQLVSPARYAASLTQTDTTTTTASPSRSGGSAEPITSSTTPASVHGVPLDDLDARFTYVAKADAGERPRVPSATGTSPNAANRRCALCNRSEITGSRCECAEPQWERETPGHVSHPTVKPLALMRWLVRLVTPPGGTILEPFAGSGTTVEACILEGFHCIAIEKGEEYLPLIMSRITRQRDPVEAIKLAGEDLGLFADLEEWKA